MKVPWQWLKDYVDLVLPAEEIARRLTMAGVEVDTIHRRGARWEKIWVGQIKQLEPHPKADRLQLATVDYGEGRSLRVVTGATNIRAGDKVPFAEAGALLFNAHASPPRAEELKPRAVRGIPSEGMVCSALELGLGEDHAGILVLHNEARIGATLADELGDVIFELDIKGPRPDLLSMLGVAREVAALTRQQLRLPPGLAPQSLTGRPDVSIRIENSDLCPRYTGVVLRNLRVGDSPAWMQHRLQAAGMRPVNNIVDMTNYVMLEWGQPLHAFDLEQLAKREIVVRTARPGERLITLDGADRELTGEMLVIADAERPQAIAGVMGGAASEVRPGTTQVLLESANFYAPSIRRTRRALGLPSEASRRFERGLPPEHTVPAALRAAQLMVDLASAEVVGPVVDAYPRPRTQPPIPLTQDQVARLLGIALDWQETQRALRALEFVVEARDGQLIVTPPAHRTDVSIPADVIEDIARIIGYDRIPATMLSGTMPQRQPNAALRGEDFARDLLAAGGFDEVILYAATSRAKLQRLPMVGAQRTGNAAEVEHPLSPKEREGEGAPGDGAPGGLPHPSAIPLGQGDRAGARLARWVQERVCPADGEPLVIANPLSSEWDCMRTVTLPAMLETLRENLKHEDRDVHMFELGRIYLASGAAESGALPEERRVLTAVTGAYRSGDVWGTHVENDFFAIKGVAEELLGRMAIKNLGFVPLRHPLFHPLQAAAILVGHRPEALGRAPIREEQVLGAVGEISREVREAFDVHERCYVLLVDFDRVLAHQSASRRYSPVPRFPPVVRDLAVLVDREVPSDQVAAVIRRAGGELVSGLELFDVYEGDQIPPGKRSLAYSLRFQAPDRTLTDVEAAGAQTKIVRALERQLGATLRGG